MSDMLLVEMLHRIESLEKWREEHCADGLVHYHEHDIEDSSIDVSAAVEEHLNKAASEIEAAMEAEQQAAQEPEQPAVEPPPAPVEPPKEEIAPKREHLLHRRIG